MILGAALSGPVTTNCPEGQVSIFDLEACTDGLDYGPTGLSFGEGMAEHVEHSYV